MNKDTSLYGSYDYQAVEDIARFVAIPQTTSRYYETLTFDIDLIPNHAMIYLSWEHTQVAFEVETTTDVEIEQYIQNELLTGKKKASNLYAGAAEYHFYQGTNVEEAHNLADKALGID